MLQACPLMQHGPGEWRRRGDALRILLQVWRHRDDPIFLPGACESLAELANDERAVDELEVYVPQLAYMILGLPADSLLSSVLERFALRVCETNAHWALQLSWTVYAALEVRTDLLPRPMWCDYANGTRYGWRLTHLLKVRLWQLVLAEGNVAGMPTDAARARRMAAPR